MAILPVGIGPQEGGYQIERSLRFNSADSAKLTRTPASAGNRKTWTFSAWVKRSALGSSQGIFHCYDGSASRRSSIQFNSDNTIGWDQGGSGTSGLIDTVAVYRDVSAWYHLVCVADYSNGTAANRAKIYINNTLQTVTTTDDFDNADGLINSTNPHQIGSVDTVSYFNGYMTEINFIDGQALDPTSFGEYNTDTGVWQPKAYTGSYGTNGFYLDFADNSSTTALGYDAAGSNDWTPNNFSVTAGAGNDSLVDTPTPYGTDTGVGGEVRGNYATMNPLDQAGSLLFYDGNLKVTANTGWDGSRATMAYPSSGKWYWEATCNQRSTGATVGILGTSAVITGDLAASSLGYIYNSGDGNKYNNGSNSAYGATWTTGDVVGIAWDADAGTLSFYKNGTSQGTAWTGLSGTFSPAIGVNGSDSMTANFGQRPFAYTAPSGFKALCTQNLPEPTVVDGSQYFDVALYTGNGVTTNDGNTITGLNFKPDFVWLKCRSSAETHSLQDVLRGPRATIYSQSTEGENANRGYINSFTSDGFTTGNANGASINPCNANGATYATWCWKAGGTGVTNTAGTITSTVSANTTAGFSIITYTGNGTSGATVGHGLGAVPSMVIVKSRSLSTESWPVKHISLASTKNLLLNSTTDAYTPGNGYIADLSSSTTFSLTTGVTNADAVNKSSATYVAYCFAPVAGYSAFGSYVGNGSSDGPFVYTGFRPKFVLTKNASGAGFNWVIHDTSRSPYNLAANKLEPNQSNAESSSNDMIDILSNGFKLKTADPGNNANGSTYIYAAFAENPFKYSLAR